MWSFRLVFTLLNNENPRCCKINLVSYVMKVLNKLGLLITYVHIDTNVNNLSLNQVLHACVLCEVVRSASVVSLILSVFCFVFVFVSSF